MTSDKRLDAIRALVLSGVAATDLAAPGVGSIGATLLGSVWQPMAGKRLQEVVDQIGEDLEQLAVESEVRWDELLERLTEPDMYEVTCRAVETATISADEAHRRRCRAAILNSYRMPSEAAFNLKLVQMLRELTPAHFELIEWWDDHADNFDGRSDDLAQEIADSLDRPVELVALLIDELDRYGLATIGEGTPFLRTDGTSGAAEHRPPKLMPLGRRLRDFVKMPVDGR